MSKNCVTCNRPISSIKNRKPIDSAIYIFGNEVSVVEMSDQMSDQRDILVDILTKLSENNEIPSAKETLKEIKKFKGPIGEESYEMLDVGKCGFEVILDSVADMLGSDSGILPHSTVYHSKITSKTTPDSINHLTIISRPPSLIDINYMNTSGQYKTYRLSIPFLCFCSIVSENLKSNKFKLMQANLFLTTEPIYNTKVNIYRLPLHNQGHYDGIICMGSVKPPNADNLAEFINGSFVQIMNANWNQDLHSSLDEVPSFLGGNHENWEQKSLNDNFIGMNKEIKWQPHAPDIKTLKQLIDQKKATLPTL